MVRALLQANRSRLSDLSLLSSVMRKEARFQPPSCLKAHAKQTSEVAPPDTDGTEIGRDKKDASAPRDRQDQIYGNVGG